MQTHDVNTIGLTGGQFSDLCAHIREHGKFTGWAGIDWQELSHLNEIREPGDLPEPLTVYMADGWPVAVFQFDTGYTVIPAALADVRARHSAPGESKQQA